MPFSTRLFVKTSLVYAVLAAAFFALADAASFFHWRGFSPYQTALHLFLVGWVLQLIFGIGHWMFPKYSRERPRGYEGLMYFAYVALNLGLVARLVVEPFPGLWLQSWSRGLLLFSGLAQWAGLLAAVFNLALRIKVR